MVQEYRPATLLTVGLGGHAIALARVQGYHRPLGGQTSPDERTAMKAPVVALSRSYLGTIEYSYLHQ